MRFPLALVIAAAPLVGGCINTDTAVFVDPSIDDAKVDVLGGPLALEAKGSFTLSLHLGARASGSSSVSVGQFEIQDAQMTGAIVTPLPVDSGSTQFPVTVDQDSTVTVAMTFDSGAKLPVDLKDKLCDAAGVMITGTIQDSLQTSATPVQSAVIHATGCP